MLCALLLVVCYFARRQVSLSAFSYLFSELVQYCQQRVDAVAELEKR